MLIHIFMPMQPSQQEPAPHPGDQQSTNQRLSLHRRSDACHNPSTPQLFQTQKQSFITDQAAQPPNTRGLGGLPHPPRKRVPREMRALNHFDVCTSAPVSHPTPPVHSRLRFSLEIKITLVKR